MVWKSSFVRIRFHWLLHTKVVTFSRTGMNREFGSRNCRTIGGFFLSPPSTLSTHASGRAYRTNAKTSSSVQLLFGDWYASVAPVSPVCEGRTGVEGLVVVRI